MKKTTAEVVNLVKKFEARTLKKSEWNHEAHLLVGLYYCLRFPFGQATNLMRDGIYWLNDALKIPNTNFSGYHETLTIFWMLTIKQFVETNKTYNLGELATDLVKVCGDSKLPFRYYSYQVLFSPEARINHISPDLDRFYLFANSANMLVNTGKEDTLSNL